MLQLQRQLLKQQQQVKKAASKQLPPKGGSSAGSVKATAQRVGTAVKQKIQQDMTVTRALADNIRRNSERTARQIKPDASPKVRYSGSNGPNPKPRNLPPVTKPVRSGSSAVTTPPKPRQPRGGQLATQGRGPLGGQRALPPGVKGGGVEKAGQTIDVKANSSKAPTSKPTPAGTGAAQASPPRGSGSPLPNSARRGGNLPRAGAKAIRGRVADVRPATPSATAAKPSASVPPASATTKSAAQATRTSTAQPTTTPAKPVAKGGLARNAKATALKTGRKLDQLVDKYGPRATTNRGVVTRSVLGTAAIMYGAHLAEKAANPKEWERISAELKQRREADMNKQSAPKPAPKPTPPGVKGARSPQASAKTKSETVGGNKPTGTTGGKAPVKRPEYKRPKAQVNTPSAAQQATDKRDKKKLF